MFVQIAAVVMLVLFKSAVSDSPVRKSQFHLPSFIPSCPWPI